MARDQIPVTADMADEYTERVQDVIAPVAVAVVAAEPLRIQRHPSREFTTGSATVQPGTVVQVIGSNPFRERLLLTMEGDSVVYVGPDRDTLTPAGGYPLKPGDQVELHTRHAVYVIGHPDAPEAASVHFLAEHVDG
ncbi:hypothetical protein [Streptomyces sp. NPDC048157]|uniref:hypothetical protein n=1 Tax=Streptomyces sp. NPDC048157 TaxID=3365503 RepID=UPI003711060C